MAYTKYSLTPANNTAAPPDGAPEGMLPSAVNDTMRDMMAQIRDVGDGVRDGTYTMTAPKITGGTITGVTLTGNTFSSPVISGGTINNATIGATTASTGAFTTLTSNGATTFTANTASTSTTTGTTVITGGLGVSGRINAANFDGIVGANTAAAGSFTTINASTSITNAGLTSGRVTYAGASGLLSDNANFVFNGTDLGVGTASPAVTLHASASVTNSGGIGTEILRVANTRANTGTSGASISFITNEIESTNQYIRGQITGEYDGSSNVNGRLLFATANTSGTLAERMRITSTGNVGIGTSSPYGLLNIKGTNGQLVLANGNSSGGVKITATDVNYTANGYLAFEGYANEYGRFDASGNLGIGTASPAGKLHVMKTATGGSPQNAAGNQIVMENGDSSGSADLQFLSANNGYNHIFFGDADDANIGTLLYDHNTNSMQFVTNTAERARITSGGDFYVGTTTGTIGTGNFGVVNAQDGGIFASRNEDGSVVVFQVGGNVGLLRVLGNGNAQNTNNSYGAISDVKLKENIVDATPKLADLMQVKVRNYNMIGDTTKQIGVVAQELETVFPSMIDVTLDKDAEGNDLGTTTKAVKYSVFVPMLIKAMQEQQALIESLITRLTALENK